ncbi:MAG: transcription termination/antitermination protein NusG [Oscillospiraceae bacterium]|nr:transcription termination/antitermination protein NusG [Oscillospiraceae bacterium]
MAQTSNYGYDTTTSRWYVAQTYAGYENKVKANLEKIVENRNMAHLFEEIRIPTETLIEKNKDGEDVEVENKILPSYVMIKMTMTDESWHVVRNIRGVTGFVGPAGRPVPLSDEEISNMGVDVGVASLGYEVGDSVKITKGALAGFIGVVKEISDDRKKITVMASMFGRETPVELESDSVAVLTE